MSDEQGREGGNTEQSAGVLPLEGLRLIEISTYVAGPSGAMTLAQLGAEVIRIDPLGGATDTRRLPLDAKGNSLYWAGLNKGKRSVEINMSSDEGRRLVLELLRVPGPGNGFLLTNAVGQRWLEYESLRLQRPDLVQVHILGRSDGKPAVDYTVNSEVGLPLITGPVDVDRPVNHVLPAWDLMTGLHAAIAILSAERLRARTGRGQKITLSLANVAVATMAHLGFVADVVVNGRGRLREGNYLYGSFGCDFSTADGNRVMVVALTSRHWRNLVELCGVGEAIDALQKSLGVDLSDEEGRYRYREVLSALMRPWFESRTYDEMMPLLDESQVLWGPYRSVEQFVTDPASLLHTSGLMADVDQPGIGTFPSPRSVLQFEGWEERTPTPAPIVGQHTDAVLSEMLSLSGSELETLRDNGIIGGRSPQ
jgi:2-methylfumaryl-CoA isomerase